mmetsp:Transcript_22439/g.44061  ORF Transcript_22439/g.44061 Transcript_22439/m.44061 type:complete len:104 (+) Transcript_22439:322-633(+)
MTQGLDRRLRYMERSRKEPLPWLKHKLYLLRLWSGAYMLDDWEAGMLLVMLLLVAYFIFTLVAGGPDAAQNAETVAESVQKAAAEAASVDSGLDVDSAIPEVL